MTNTPDPDDSIIRGLDGEPVEITDEKLHELIDAMNGVGDEPPGLDELDDFFTVARMWWTLGELLIGDEHLPALILNIDYRCGDGCEVIHNQTLAIRIVPAVITMLASMCVKAREVTTGT